MGTKQHSALVGANLHVTKDDSVGPPQLQIDAVETISIKDENVTEPKLETDFLRKYLEGRQVFYDDFLGAVLDNRWAESGDAGGSAVITTRSSLLLTTDTDINDIWRINWNGKQGIYMGKFPKLFARITVTDLANPDVEVALWKDVNNYVEFFFNPGLNPNWLAVSSKGGVAFSFDTGVAVTVNPVKLKIDVVSATEVRYYINGVFVYTETNATFIPNTVDVEPQIELQAIGSAPVTLKVDTVILTANPE